jgi:hypothetical protein
MFPVRYIVAIFLEMISSFYVNMIAKNYLNTSNIKSLIRF